MDLSSWRRVFTTQMGLVTVLVVIPAVAPAVNVILVNEAFGRFCSRRRFVLEYVYIFIALSNVNLENS